MLNFTVGPVMSRPETLAIASGSAPYFRTAEFSEVVLRAEEGMLGLLHAPEGSRCVFLTSSGTGAMEAVVMGVLSPADTAVVVNGGSFGQRFADLCALHGVPAREVRLGFGRQIGAVELDEALDGATALLVNIHETSSGLLYDMPLIARACGERGVLLVVDAISSFVADELDMEGLGADVVITGSQKALACHPGASVVALSPRAQDRVAANPERCMYLSLRRALADGARGQTPWTPAVATLLQLAERIGSLGGDGMERERARIRSLAVSFRAEIAGWGLETVPENPSNAVTAIRARRGNAGEVVGAMRRDHGIWVCPNGGEHAADVFRVGHIGAISDADQDELIAGLGDLVGRGIL